MLGLSITKEVNEGLVGARFCKIEFVEHEGKYYGWKNPTSALLKFGLKIGGHARPGTSRSNDYIYGKAHSMLEEFKGLEPMENVFREVLRQVGKGRKSGYEDNPYRIRAQPSRGAGVLFD